jgi:hypothetical protein
MPLINPCLHISTCEPCCPVYDNRALAELDSAVEMTLTVVTQSQRKTYTYKLPPKSDAIFLTDRAKRMFLNPYLSSRKNRPPRVEWPDEGDPEYGTTLNVVRVELD